MFEECDGVIDDVIGFEVIVLEDEICEFRRFKVVVVDVVLFEVVVFLVVVVVLVVIVKGCVLKLF